MKIQKISRSKTNVYVALFSVLLISGLQACPVCFTAPDSAETRGMTMAILFLLGVIGFVVCGVASFFIYLIAKQSNPEPGHEELAHLVYENQTTAR